MISGGGFLRVDHDPRTVGLDAERWQFVRTPAGPMVKVGPGPRDWETADFLIQAFQLARQHSQRHEAGGADAINVAGLPGLLADPQNPRAHQHTIANVTNLANLLQQADARLQALEGRATALEARVTALENA